MSGHVCTARQVTTAVTTMRNWKKEWRGRCKGGNAREEKKKENGSKKGID